MGGRDVNNVELTNPFEYDPAANSWTTKSATYPDTFTNNMACGVLNDSGTDYIYCVGGSNFVTQTDTGRVFRYDPIADVSSPLPRSLAAWRMRASARWLHCVQQHARHSGWLRYS